MRIYETTRQQGIDLVWSSSAQDKPRLHFVRDGKQCGLLYVWSRDMQTSLGAAHRDLLHLNLDSQRAKREQTQEKRAKINFFFSPHLCERALWSVGLGFQAKSIAKRFNNQGLFDPSRLPASHNEKLNRKMLGD